MENLIVGGGSKINECGANCTARAKISNSVVIFCYGPVESSSGALAKRIEAAYPTNWRNVLATF